MWALWQSLPLSLHPTALKIGFLSVSWYALCYLFGAVGVVLWLLRSQSLRELIPERERFWSLVNMVLWGVLFGARLGYVLFYGETSYWAMPWRIVSPYDFSTGVWTGIRGLSFYGGLLGGGVALFLFIRREKIIWWSLADALVPALPIGLFFGRLGNFLNGELIGRPTQEPWGMHFLISETILRHPSQLYEALGEGVLLFLLLYFLAQKKHRPGFLSLTFIFSYGIVRFFLEFFRSPDPGTTLFLGWLTLNQILALTLCFVAIWLSQGFSQLWYNRKNRIIA